MEIDQATRDIFTLLELQSKYRDDPHFTTKQLLKDNTCINCWRLAGTDDSRFYCGAPKLESKRATTKKAEGTIIETPETETCEFFVRVFAKRNHKGSRS